MKSISFMLTLVALTVFTACTTYKDHLLLGEWQAIQLLEEGKPLEIDIDEIRLKFNGSAYTFNSTLNYKEAGSYFVDDSYLFTTDTVNLASTEKAVEIVSLTNDTLVLKMRDRGKERLLKLHKKE